MDKLQGGLFCAVAEFPTTSWNIDSHVLEVFMATLIHHFPGMERPRPYSPYVLRVRDVRACLAQSCWLGRSLFALHSIHLVKKSKLAQQLDELLLRQARVEDRLAALDANTWYIEQTRSTKQHYPEAPEQAE